MSTNTVFKLNSARTRALAETSFLIAQPNSERWEGTFADQLGLEPRVLPMPQPRSRDSSKAASVSLLWNLAHGRLAEADPDDALKIAQNTNDRLFNRHRHRPKVTIGHLEHDRFDPGTKLMKAIELASYALFHHSADGTFPNVEFIDRLGADLLSFHKAHHDVNDVRFTPLRSMGRCLQTLARILRKAD